MPLTINSEKVGISCEKEIGATTAEFVELFGEDVAYSMISQSVSRIGGNKIRTLHKKGKSPEEIQQAIADWKPGVVVRGTGKTLEKKKTDTAYWYQNIATEEEKKEYLADLMGKAEGEKGKK